MSDSPALGVVVDERGGHGNNGKPIAERRIKMVLIQGARLIFGLSGPFPEAGPGQLLGGKVLLRAPCLASAEHCRISGLPSP